MSGYGRRRGRNINHINVCVKYTIFFFNFVFWVSINIVVSYFLGLNFIIFFFFFFQLLGGIFVGVGLYAFFEKWKGTGYSLVLNAEQMILDISIIMLIVGFVMFTVSFAGCVGALRENSCLLKFVRIICKIILKFLHK